jgi:diguanylate cyclase (GGDEF)-like protein
VPPTGDHVGMVSKRVVAGWVIPTYCVVGAGLTGLYFFMSGSVDAQRVVYQAVGVFGVLGLSFGIWRHRPEGVAWPLILLGLVLWVSGDGYWNADRLLTGREAPFPSPADGLYLLAYAPLVAGIVIMVRGGLPRAADVVDALIIGLAMSLIVWFVAIHPIARAHEPSLATAAIADTYPTMDNLLLLALVQLLVSRRRSAALIWVTSAFATVLVTDLVYAWLRSNATFTAASLVNAGYFAFYVLLGASSLTPSMRDVSGRRPSAQAEPAPTDSGKLGLLRLALLLTALLASPAALVLQGSESDLASILIIAGVGALISVLVLVRLVILFVERDCIDADRRRAEAVLKEMAYRDSLTGLPNRSAILHAIDQLVGVPQGRMFGILFVDLDRFKSVNDRFGHAAGDDVLRETAKRLSTVVRAGETVARYGGDEFIVVLHDLPLDNAAAIVAAAIQRIRDAVGQPHQIHDPNGERLDTATVEASVGVALHPTDAITTTSLIRRADKRMYDQKHAGSSDAHAA